MMNDYGNAGSTKNRNNVKSPQSHAIEDSKIMKKKYEQAKEALKEEKRKNDLLEKRIKEIEEQIQKQQRELQKKLEINDVLLDRSKCLKNGLADLQAKKSSQENSYQDKTNSKSKTQQSSQTISVMAPTPVGGYFGKVFS